VICKPNLVACGSSRREESLVRASGLLLAITILGCTDTGTPAADADTVAATSAPAVAPVAAVAPLASDLQGSVQEVVRRVRPAVVQITNQRSQGSLAEGPELVPAGVGSGVIYSSEGHILTNNHVIADAEGLLVSLPDGRSSPARLVGRDPSTDLAVLQIDGENLPTAPLGDSSRLRLGEWVVAIGNALALPGGPTVTVGVVSALDRAVPEPESAAGGGNLLLGLIQTDAAINPGNSGGPLLNLAGEVIGINTLGGGEAESGVPIQSIGFAISSDTFTRISKQLVETGRAIHPYLGIRYVPLNAAIARALETTATEGLAIAAVQPGSPAERGGIRARDVITRVEGQTVRDRASLARVVDARAPGESLSVSVVRGSQTHDLTVVLGEAPQ
jgi:S1-C subfamily serine protease